MHNACQLVRGIRSMDMDAEGGVGAQVPESLEKESECALGGGRHESGEVGVC